MRFDAILFDFDGVLIESEYEGNRQIAEYLSARGWPTTPLTAMTHFMGLSGDDFIGAVEGHIGASLPDDFHTAREVENLRVLSSGIGEVAGAVAFVRALPDKLPRAIASSSSTHWIETHLDHLGLRGAFAPHIYSGKEHVARGKPHPDLYLHAAERLGVPIGRVAIIEDSPIGAKGAVASGATVIGLCAGSHCGIGHDARLRELGVDHIAHDFAEVARLLEIAH